MVYSPIEQKSPVPNVMFARLSIAVRPAMETASTCSPRPTTGLQARAVASSPSLMSL